jgi:hypothetical protein
VGEWLPRMRYNPFHDVLGQGVPEWFRNAQPKGAGAPG